MYRQDIPDIDIIDLDDSTDANTRGMDAAGTDDTGMDNTGMDDIDTDTTDTDDTGTDNTDTGDRDADTTVRDASDMDEVDVQEPTRRKKLPINIHIVLLAVVLLTFGYIFYKYVNFGQIVEPNENPTEPDNYTAESYDNILALTDEEGNVIAPDLEDGLSIVVFGNGPFAEDRNTGEGLAALLAETTGATVYNCTISGSQLASTLPGNPDMSVNPWDAFCFYWMSVYSTGVDVIDFYGQALEALGEDAPPEAAEVRETLSSLDFDTVDVIVIMYDATDYFAGSPAGSTDDIPAIQSFAGNLKAGLGVLQQYHPNTRIIVMSPTYAFSDRLDEDGSYISSDIVRYGQDVLSTYVSKSAESCSEAQVTFVDNFYVTFNEDNALNYLRDNMHLNSDGRKKVIERLEYALHYYDAFYE